MNLILDSRFISFALRISDARKGDSEDRDGSIVVDLTAGQYDPAPVFGFQMTEEEDE